PCQNSFFHEHVEIFLVREVAFHVLCPKEEPVFSLRTGGMALLQIRSKRRNPSTRPHHNNMCIRIFREMKMFCVTGENRHGYVVRALSKKRRGHTFAHTAMTFVTNDIYNQMHLVGKRRETRRNRIEPRLEF